MRVWAVVVVVVLVRSADGVVGMEVVLARGSGQAEQVHDASAHVLRGSESEKLGSPVAHS